MDAQLSQEIEKILSVMRRQNKEIERLILKEGGMKVIRCTGKSQSPNFDLREINQRSNNH
jgi:hypothetical protein